MTRRLHNKVFIRYKLPTLCMFEKFGTLQTLHIYTFSPCRIKPWRAPQLQSHWPRIKDSSYPTYTYRRPTTVQLYTGIHTVWQHPVPPPHLYRAVHFPLYRAAEHELHLAFGCLTVTLARTAFEERNEDCITREHMECQHSRSMRD